MASALRSRGSIRTEEQSKKSKLELEPGRAKCRITRWLLKWAKWENEGLKRDAKVVSGVERERLLN